MITVYHKKMKDVWFGAAVKDNRVVATNYSFGEEDWGRLLRRLPFDVPFQVAEEPNQLSTDVLGVLREIFEGKDRGSYEFKIDMEYLSSYARKVLSCTRLVPVGYVTSYGALAEVAGGIARSVGRVEATNPFPLLVPCHRVVRSDLRIGGYGYGTRVKWELLGREKRGYEEAKQLKVGNGKLSLFPVERVKQTVI
jgi:methylated-DNA-[protein]-cysteine S-methyltransferase